MSSWEAFHAMENVLDTIRTGPLYLKQPQVAQITVDAIKYNARELEHYELHSFVVMPNHVHLLLTPRISIPALTKSLKGITAKRANLWLGLTGNPFWQDETFDRNIRNRDEFTAVRAYIENKPVKAGLVHAAVEYPWSSARKQHHSLRTNSLRASAG